MAGANVGGALRVATCQFAETFDPRENAATIRSFMDEAASQQAQLVHFHECALTGYLARPGAPRAADVDWSALKQETQAICRHAQERKLWVVLGSCHPLTPPHKPTNCLYLIGPDGTIRDRYDKRFCTAADLDVFTPGDRYVLFTIGGVRCALLICFDLRFPELYRELKTQGAQALFQSFHNGYTSGPGVHTHIMRQTMQAHAGINYMWVSANNSSGRYSRWPSVFIQPDGVIVGQLRQNRPGMMVNDIDARGDFYDASIQFRDAAIAGARHSGQTVHDPRQADTTSL